MIITILLVILCLFVSYTDLKERIIPNRLTHPIICILFLWRLYQMESSFLWGLLPAFILMIVLFIRPAAIGAGDVKLFAIVGLVVGFQTTITVIFMMGAACLLYMLIEKALRKSVGGHIPLAPFITVGLILALAFQTVFQNVLT